MDIFNQALAAVLTGNILTVWFVYSMIQYWRSERAGDDYDRWSTILGITVPLVLASATVYLATAK